MSNEKSGILHNLKDTLYFLTEIKSMFNNCDGNKDVLNVYLSKRKAEYGYIAEEKWIDRLIEKFTDYKYYLIMFKEIIINNNFNNLNEIDLHEVYNIYDSIDID